LRWDGPSPYRLAPIDSTRWWVAPHSAETPSSTLLGMTTEIICLDSNYLVALFDRRDTWHENAADVHHVLRELRASTVITDCVINEALTVFGRRCRERRQPEAFTHFADLLLDAVPKVSVTWLYPHVLNWFDRCVAIMRKTAGALNFHDALIAVAAEELGYRAVVSFDSGFDLLVNLTRLDSAVAARTWLEAP